MRQKPVGTDSLSRAPQSPDVSVEIREAIPRDIFADLRGRPNQSRPRPDVMGTGRPMEARNEEPPRGSTQRNRMKSLSHRCVVSLDSTTG